MTTPAVAENVFTYGTLQIPEIMQALTGESYRHTSATVENFASYQLKNRIYPGAIAENGACIKGILYFSLSDSALKILDVFEDILYERQSVTANTEIGEYQASIYVVTKRFAGLLNNKSWDIERFRELHREKYLNKCNRFHVQLKKALKI